MISSIWLIPIIGASAADGFYLGGKLMGKLMASQIEQNLRNQGWSQEAIRKKIFGQGQ